MQPELGLLLSCDSLNEGCSKSQIREKAALAKSWGIFYTSFMQEILGILEKDALASAEKISQMLKRPVDEVRRQIRQMEEDRVILAYKAIVDDEKASRNLVRAVIEVKITPERDGGFNRLAARIARYDEVKTCYLMSGGYDLLVIVEGTDLKKVATFVSEKLATIQGVLSTATHFMLKTYKDQGTLYAGEATDERLKVSP